MDIKAIEKKEDFIGYYDWIRAIDYSDITPEICLARCLVGDYIGMIGIKEGETVGIIIYKITGSDCWVVGLWCTNNLSGFQSKFFEFLKKKGVTKVRSSTTRPEKGYGKLMGMRRLWTVYEKVL